MIPSALTQDWHKALRPSNNWGPKDPAEHREYLRFLQQRGLRRLSEQELKLVRPQGEVKSDAVSPHSPSVDRPASLTEAAPPSLNSAPLKRGVVGPDVNAVPPAAVIPGANVTANPI